MPMAEGELALRVRIHGRVQGVCYRAWTRAEALALGLDGWVRNRRDGTVEAVFRGSSGAVREMVSRCRGGPPAARVLRVDATDETGAVAGGFRQLPTS
jgi:acylphosphatase